MSSVIHKENDVSSSAEVSCIDGGSIDIKSESEKRRLIDDFLNACQHNCRMNVHC